MHKSAANNAVRAELGIFPVAIYCLRSSVSFWLHIIQSKDTKLVKISYEDTCNINKSFGNIFRTFLMKLNFLHVWENQGTFSKARLVNKITAKLKDSYTTYWHNLIFDDSQNPINGNKLRTYRKLKNEYRLEKYLLSNENSRAEISTFCKIRVSARRLLVEEGRYKKIPLGDRICKLCKNGIEDEQHFILHCTALEHIRKQFFENLSSICPSFENMSDVDKMHLCNKEYDINVVCISKIYSMYSKRNVLSNILHTFHV